MPITQSLLRPLAAAPLIAAIAALSPFAAGQCQTEWLPSGGHSGVSGPVHASILIDPDGAGPAPENIIVGGNFTLAGTGGANHIAMWQPQSGAWSSLGAGVDGVVCALTALANGDLIAAGQFDTAGNAPAAKVARWDGFNWHALGAGVNGEVSALLTTSNGDVIAGGEFTTAGGLPASRVARWNGTTWSPLGAGLGGNSYWPAVRTLAELPNGDILAGGNFNQSGSSTVTELASWNGSTWSTFAGGAPGAVPSSLAVRSNGNVIMCDRSPVPNPLGRVREWDGTNWVTYASDPLLTAHHVMLASNGDLVVSGAFSSIGTTPADNIARWNGSTWSSMASSGSSWIRTSQELTNGDIVAAGDFDSLGGTAADNVAAWNGVNWTTFATPGYTADVRALLTRDNGDVIAGGLHFLDRWDGATWSSLNLPMGSGDRVYALAERNGDLIAAGDITLPGTVGSSAMRYDGTSWSQFTSACNGAILAIAVAANGDLIAGGSFSTAGGVPAQAIARWNGTTWQPLGPGLAGAVRTILALPNGDIVAGINPAASDAVHRWDGNQWQPMGIQAGSGWGPPTVHRLRLLRDGSIVAAGDFYQSGSTGIARWTGTNWQPFGTGVSYYLGPGTAYDVQELPNGDLVCCGQFDTIGGQGADNIARWDGSNWSAISGGTNARTTEATTLANGNILVAGTFTTAGQQASNRLAYLTTTCPATATVFGSGCSGSAGPNVLTSATLPWVGSVSRAVATGMPANGLAVGVLGLSTTSIQLQAVLPQAHPSCMLLAAPTWLTASVPIAGIVETEFTIPTLPSLAGLTAFQQVVALELDAQGSIVGVTSTNALSQVVGVF